MSTRDLILAGIEQSINGLLQMDPGAGKKLAVLHGRVVAIHFRGIELTLFFVPDQRGRLQVLGNMENPPDATLSGSPLDLLRSGDQKTGAAQLFGGRVSIDGDAHLAHKFGAILSGLDIDWEEQLSRITGDIIAHQTGRTVRAAADRGRYKLNLLEQDLSEYLTEEARLLPHPYEVEEFVQRVDELRDDVERLEAHLSRLEKNS